MLAVVACCDEFAAHRYALLQQIGGTAAQVSCLSLLAFSSSRAKEHNAVQGNDTHTTFLFKATNPISKLRFTFLVSSLCDFSKEKKKWMECKVIPFSG